MKTSSSLCLLLSLLLLHRKLAIAEGTDDGSEEWGYVEVRPKAQMFWWLYRSPQRAEYPNSPWPTILWLQGGPGASGAGIGNFLEIGPLGLNMKPRNLTWLQKADLLFVDNPVGTGFSYVEDERLVVRTDEEAATDLTTLLKEIINNVSSIQTSPLFIVGESYGGKFAVTLGVSVLKAIQNRELKLTLGGVALGDSWISPEDFVFSWGPLLKDVSRLDDNGLKDTNGQAQVIKQQIEKGQYEDATVSWSNLEDVITGRSDAVDFYNFMLDSWRDPLSMVSMRSSKRLSMKKYSSYLSADLSMIMNGAIREKLKIIPKNVVWGGQSDLVLSGLYKDFMKPRINESWEMAESNHTSPHSFTYALRAGKWLKVDELLSNGVNITIYNGQLDVICATKGAEAWVQKLKWGGLKAFTNLDRTPLYCKSVPHDTKGFTKSYKNLNFYWVLMSGHFVPVDQPCVALQMIGEITHSPVHTY